MSLYTYVTVPICAMVDGSSASAATAITVFAPYRVAASPFVLTLIHDYAGGIHGPRELTLANVKRVEEFREMVKGMYLKYLKIDESTLEATLRRDILWDVATCLEYGVYDRVLFSSKTRDTLVLPSRHPLRKKLSTDGGKTSSLPSIKSAPFIKSNWNHVSVTCSPECPKMLDDILSQGGEGLKPIVLRSPEIDTSSYSPMMIVKSQRGAQPSRDGFGFAEECSDTSIAYAIIPRLLACPVPVYGIVDNKLDWWKFLPVFFCTHRYMYETAGIVSFLAYSKERGRRLNDIIHNTNVIQSLLERSLNSNVNSVRLADTNASLVGEGRAALDAALKTLFDRSQVFTPEQCLRMGLVDEIIPLDR